MSVSTTIVHSNGVISNSFTAPEIESTYGCLFPMDGNINYLLVAGV